MEEASDFRKTGNRLLNSLFSTVEHFRSCRDHWGMDGLLKSMDELEILLACCPHSAKMNRKMEEMLPHLQALHGCMRNQDITGMTDTLESRLYPLTKEWVEAWEE